MRPLTRPTLILATALAGGLLGPLFGSLSSSAPTPGTPQEGSEGPADTPAPTTRPEEEPVPEGVAAVVDDEIVISLDEYKDYLLEIYGRRPLEDLIYDRLLAREAAAEGLEIGTAEIDAMVEEKWDQLLNVRHQGRLEDLARELAGAGFTPESYRASLRVKERVTAFESAIATAQREVTDAMVSERFEREYGVGGVAVEVRHIYLNRARLKADLVRGGADAATLDNEALDAALTERAGDLLAQLRAGEDFETLARANSHDLSVQQNGGFIPGYNYRRYGDTMASAVRLAEVGVPYGPVQTPSGLHVIEVTERRPTKFEDVREELIALLRAEPASWKERGDLRVRLFGQSVIRTY